MEVHVEPRVVTTARGAVEVAVLGSGPAVLFAHGMPGSWRQALGIGHDLALSHRVLLVTRPGYGRTPLGSGRSAADQGDLYAALLDELGIATTTAVGISGGGPSVVAFAQRHPDRVTGLALLCALAAHVMAIPSYGRVGVRIPGVPRAFGALGQWRDRRVTADDRRLAARIDRLLTPTELAIFEGDRALRDDFAALMRSNANGLPWGAGFGNDVRDRDIGRAPTDAITARTLVVHGDTDTVVPMANAEHHVEAIAGARLEIVEGASHALPMTHRRRIVQLLRAL